MPQFQKRVIPHTQEGAAGRKGHGAYVDLRMCDTAFGTIVLAQV
jgi:hypothetical protein